MSFRDLLVVDGHLEVEPCEPRVVDALHAVHIAYPHGPHVSPRGSLPAGPAGSEPYRMSHSQHGHLPRRMGTLRLCGLHRIVQHAGGLACCRVVHCGIGADRPGMCIAPCGTSAAAAC